MAEDRRLRDLAANLRAVRVQIAEACLRAGRPVDEVTLVAVTKTYPAEDVLRLASLGVTDIGENRDQEAAPKAAQVAAATARADAAPRVRGATPAEVAVGTNGAAGAGVGVRWHFVGQLQRNKCRSVVTYADVVHSVDGVRLASALAEAARRRRDRPLDVLVQVSLDGDPSRGGAVTSGGARDRVAGGEGEDGDVDRVLAAVAEAEALRLRGLMAVAPLGWEPERAFEALARLAAKVRGVYPEATELSAGMSDDFGLAIGYGATLVRIGSALLGNRPRLM